MAGNVLIIVRKTPCKVTSPANSELVKIDGCDAARLNEYPYRALVRSYGRYSWRFRLNTVIEI